MKFKMKKSGQTLYCYFEFKENGGLYIKPHMKILRTRLIPLICFAHHNSNNTGKYKILALIKNYEKNNYEQLR